MPSSFGRSGVIGGGSGEAASTTGAAGSAGSSHIIGSLRARAVLAHERNLCICDAGRAVEAARACTR